ncbi:MAG: SPASM domain-containing protein [Candidatus Peribacteria bacterium]|nr:SPASM domain-containing protein [Candidatus Peribacteria bacterium]
MLIRSTGEVYACVGFEHVCKLGNISTDSLEQIIKHANQDTTLKILKT